MQIEHAQVWVASSVSLSHILHTLIKADQKKEEAKEYNLTLFYTTTRL